MSKVKVNFDQGFLNFGFDSNLDTENSFSGKLSLNEAVQEAFKKGSEIPGAKVASIEFQLTKLVVKIDTDKDGESLLELTVDLAEAFEEVAKGKI